MNHPGWELYKIYADDGITGTSTKKRTQFNNMINDAYEGKFQMIITKEVSRFSRNVLDTIAYTRELRDIGVGVIFATDQINTMEPEAEMLLSFLASMAQEESRKTSSRVVWGQTRQMERGVVFGQSLLGYNVHKGKITVNPEGAEIVRLIFHKYTAEQVSTAEIARYLTKENYLTHKGNCAWTPTAIIKILKNEKYVGDLVQKKTYTPNYLNHEKRPNRGEVPLVIIENHHEPIISREVWTMAQARMNKNHKHNSSCEGHSNRYIFSGKIKCGECGSVFVGRFKYSGGRKIRYWRCGAATKSGVCGCDIGKLIRDEDAIQMLKTAIKSLPVDFDSVICHITGLALEAVLSDQYSVPDDPDRLRKELDHIQKKKEALMDAYFSQEISKDDMHIMLHKYDLQLTELCKRIDQSLKDREKQLDPAVVKQTIRSEILGILNAETECEVFHKAMLDGMTVYKDRHIEMRLAHLPQIFYFTQ